MERLVYMNGTMVPESAATISIFDVGRMYGATFYESIRTFHHKLFQLDQHFERLRKSLAYAGFLSALDFRPFTGTSLRKASSRDARIDHGFLISFPSATHTASIPGPSP